MEDLKQRNEEKEGEEESVLDNIPEKLSDSVLQDESVIIFESNKETSDMTSDSGHIRTTTRDILSNIIISEIDDDAKGAVEILATNSEDIPSNEDSDHFSEMDSNNLKVDMNNYDTVSIQSDVTDIHLLESSVEKLKVVENQNTELICENEDQRKVIEMLRVELTRKDEELHGMETQLGVSEVKYKEMQVNSEKKVQDLQKSYELANRDKESMVIKYAMGEKDIIIARRAKEDLEKRLREAGKDKDSLQYKIKTLSTERTRLQGICESRAQETITARKETDKWREEVKVMEGKVSLTSGRLKAEMEGHKETKESLDTTFKQLCEVQGSIDEVRAECQQVISQHRVEEQNLKKKEIIHEQEQSVKLMIDSAAAAELETLRNKYKTLIEENNELSVKVQNNERELLDFQSKLSDAKETVNRQKTEIVDLYAKCAELESVRLQLEKERERCSARDSEVERLRTEAAEVQVDMSNCRRKEADLLQFTQKLTDKNVSLQSEFSSVEARASTLEEEHAKLASNLARSEGRLGEVTGQLELETSRRREETEMLARKLAEKTRSCETNSQVVVDTKAELEVVTRQNKQRLRQLTKELSAAKKRLDQLEGAVDQGSTGGLSPGSRCSSSGSLNRGGVESDLSPAEKRQGEQQVLVEKEKEGDTKDTQQLLVEKIVKLQRACARRQEKLDFLEEHVEQLLKEIKKKNKLIQTYFMNLETGALVSEESDIHKAVVGATGSGIMASLYNSKVVDSGMTLELSMEINKKLQTVLEDTLLKNITLKDNINTLGDEISRMAMNRHRAGS